MTDTKTPGEVAYVEFRYRAHSNGRREREAVLFVWDQTGEPVTSSAWSRAVSLALEALGEIRGQEDLPEAGPPRPRKRRVPIA